MKYQMDPVKYEKTKKKFNQLLARGKLLWLPYRSESDIGVQVSRIYLKNQTAYMAFMRIKAKGFQSPKTTATDSKIIFHLIVGTALFGYKGKQRRLKEGNYISVSPKSEYSIINPDPNLTCYFVMQYVDMEKKREEKRQKQLIQATERMALEDVPPPPPPTQSRRLSVRLAIKCGDPATSGESYKRDEERQQQQLVQATERMALEEVPPPTQSRRLSQRLAIKSANTSLARGSAGHLATRQEMKLPLTWSVVAKRNIPTQDATNDCRDICETICIRRK